jgi:hypothetical protein
MVHRLHFEGLRPLPSVTLKTHPKKNCNVTLTMYFFHRGNGLLGLCLGPSDNATSGFLRVAAARPRSAIRVLPFLQEAKMRFPLQEKRAKDFLCGFLAFLVLVAIFLTFAQPAQAIPAFARKYGLPCSACHITWPELNNFGQVFRDNGYQMMNDMDSPITRDPSYFPASIRITPAWHRESANNQTIDIAPGSTEGGERKGTLTTAGFDLSGMDMWFGGTLFKNVSFIVLPSSDPTATFHFESAYVRFDNLIGSRWLNFKVGRYELDEPVSEKRLWTLSADGGFYYIYHFTPLGDTNPFGGMGDNQLGVELAGHSANSYTRYAFSVVSSLDGGEQLAYGCPAVTCTSPGGRTYDYYGHFEQAFNVKSAGYMKVGAYAYYGFAPTFFETSGGSAVYGRGNRSFYRAGFDWKWYTNHWVFKGVYMHAWDSACLANIGLTTCANGHIVAGSGVQAPSWNGGFIEGQYVVSPQWDLIGRYELIRMAQQAVPGTPGNQSNLDVFTVASRWNPFMLSRAGLAVQAEYSYVRSADITNQGGAFGQPCFAMALTCHISSNSIFLATDFDF